MCELLHTRALVSSIVTLLLQRSSLALPQRKNPARKFIIENVVGAGGTTGSLRAMRARPDGYTILMGHIGTHAFSVSLYPRLAYKPDVDFEPIGLVFQQPTVIVARKEFPAKDLKEFIGYAKANAEKL